jgi:putative PIN family toxin of toxin-antitoxin system
LIVLFDTNVPVSAFIARGMSSEVLEHCIVAHHVAITIRILDEAEEVLSHRFEFPRDRVDGAVRFLQENAVVIDCEPLHSSVCRDPDDDLIIAGAVAAGADCLVTGDEDLLVLRTFEGIPIIRPADFWRFEASFLKKNLESPGP